MHHFRSMSVVAFLIAIVNVTSAQEAPPFRDAIRKFADARLEVRTYELLLTIEEQGEPTVVLDIAADAPADKLLVARFLKGGDSSNLQRLDAHTSDFNISNRLILRSRHITIDGFFDPLALGIAALRDMRRGTSLSQIADNYQDWPSLPSEILGDKSVQYGVDDDETYLLTLDPARGYSPIRLRDRTGHGGTFRVRQELTEKGGYWLPSSAVVDDSMTVRTMRFEWRSINADIGERFLPDQIQKKYNVQLRDRR